MTEEVMEQDELSLTPEEEKCVENKLRDSYLKSLKAYESSKGYSQKPKLPTLEEMVKAKLEAQLAKAKQHYEQEMYDLKGREQQYGWDSAIKFYGIQEKRLDRPELREKIFQIVDGTNFKQGPNSEEATDQLLALIPDIEEADVVGRFIDRGWTTPEELPAKLEEAKKQEKQAIYQLLCPRCQGIIDGVVKAE